MRLPPLTWCLMSPASFFSWPALLSDAPTLRTQTALHALEQLVSGGLNLAAWWTATSESQRLTILQVRKRLPRETLFLQPAIRFGHLPNSPGCSISSRASTRDVCSPCCRAQMARELLRANVSVGGQSAEVVELLCPELGDGKLERLVPAVPALVRARLDDSARPLRSEDTVLFFVAVC